MKVSTRHSGWCSLPAIVRTISSFLAAVGLLMTAACAEYGKAADHDANVVAITNQSNGTVALKPLGVCAKRLTVALGDDQTGSTTLKGIPYVTDANLAYALRLVRRCGGRIGFGRVTASSNEPLTVANFSTPLTRDLPPPDTVGTPFEQQRAFATYDSAIAVAKRATEREREEADSLEAAFTSRVRARLVHAPTDQKSAVCDFLARVILFLNEPGFETESVYSVQATDQLDNVNRGRCDQLRTNGTVIFVGATDHPLSMPSIRTQQFENIDDALSYIERAHLTGRKSP